MCVRRNKLFSPDHSRFFWNLESGRGVCKGLSLYALFCIEEPKNFHPVTYVSPWLPRVFVAPQENGKDSHLHSSQEPPAQRVQPWMHSSAFWSELPCLYTGGSQWHGVTTLCHSLAVPCPLTWHLTTLPGVLGIQDEHVWPLMGEPAEVTGRRDRLVMKWKPRKSTLRIP